MRIAAAALVGIVLGAVATYLANGRYRHIDSIEYPNATDFVLLDSWTGEVCTQTYWADSAAGLQGLAERECVTVTPADVAAAGDVFAEREERRQRVKDSVNRVVDGFLGQ